MTHAEMMAKHCLMTSHYISFNLNLTWSTNSDRFILFTYSFWNFAICFSYVLTFTIL